MGKFHVARLLHFLTFAQYQKVKESSYTMFFLFFFGSVYTPNHLLVAVS